jgi:dihydrodipicolinate synthase/N-acetylneuraminate lyase
MKMAMHLQGRFPSTTVRPPLRPLADDDIERIRADLAESGFDEWYGARGLLQGVDAPALAVT